MPASQKTTLRNRIYNRDCVKGLKNVADNSVHLAFADPPFNIGYKYDIYEDRKESQQYVNWCSEWMTELYRVLRDDGTFWLAIGDEYAAELKIAAQDTGFQLRSWVIWYYTFGVHCKNKFTRSHAHLFYFTKDPKSFTFNKEDIAVPSARQLVYGDKRANPTGRIPDDTWILRPQDAREAFQPTDDIWYIPRVNGTFKERAGFHGCQMPEQLLGRIIRACSNPDEVVLDPFSGSATTLVVAKKLGRQFLGFELSKEYAKQGTERLKRTTTGDKLEGVEDPIVSVLKTRRDAPVATVKKSSKGSKSSSASSSASRSKRNLPTVLQRGFRPSPVPPSFEREVELLRRAFARVADSPDLEHLIIDPDLNKEFQSVCDDFGVSLSPYERNRGLFRLRSSGALYSEIVEAPDHGKGEVADRTLKLLSNSEESVSDQLSTAASDHWNRVDSTLHAIEIAWRRCLDRWPENNLEEIFTAPNKGAAFDSVAKVLASGFSAAELRLNALMFRDELIKESSRKSQKSLEQADEFVKAEFESFKASEVVASDMPSIGALYRFMDDAGNIIYHGTTLNLARRIKLQFSPKGWKRMEPWTGPAESITFEWVPIEVNLSRPLMRHMRLLNTTTLLNLDF